ncbi:MAG: peptidase M28 family protein, partial [Bacteroidota bacterium]
MKILVLSLFFLPSVILSQNNDSIALKKIYNFYLTQSKCYSNLEFLTTKIGGRLTGSPEAEKAVAWAKKAMYAAGADTIILQPCMVPHWVRGKKEKCLLTSPKTKATPLRCVALGSSVGTGNTGITAAVIEVKSFDQLKALGEKNIRGKIVFYNVFFDQTLINTGHAYGGAVPYRSRGASYAA